MQLLGVLHSRPLLYVLPVREDDVVIVVAHFLVLIPCFCHISKPPLCYSKEYPLLPNHYTLCLLYC